MIVHVINGPNLNLLGTRELAVYGTTTLEDIEATLADLGRTLDIDVKCFQTNSEGVLVDEIQRADRLCDGVILNAAAYTHTSIAVRDAISAISIPVVEVHLSNPAAREPFRSTSLLAGVCVGSISGFGAESYALALLWFGRLRSAL